MNAELKPEWTAALRSADYKQGVGTLCYNGKYCCLGVLGDILTKKPDYQLTWNNNGYHTRLFHSSGAVCTYLLTGAIAELVGMSEEDQLVLSKMNDEEGKSFAEIANYIDANL